MPQLKYLALIKMGATLRGRDATRPVPSGSVSLVRIGDISQYGTLLNDEFIRVEPKESVNKDLFLRPGDVLFPNRGTRTTALAYRLDRPRTLAGAQFFILRPDVGLVLPEYLAWFLRTEEAARYFVRRRKGTYIKIIQRSDLADMEMPLPPMDVQHKIVAAANLAVEERDLSERLTVRKWEIAKGMLSKASRNASRIEP